MYLKLRFTCLNNNLLLLGGDPGTWGSPFQHLLEYPMISCKPFFLPTYPLWFDGSSLLSEGPCEDPQLLSLNLILPTTLSCTPNYQLDISTWMTERHSAPSSSSHPNLLHHYSQWNLHPFGAQAQTIVLILDFPLSFIQLINLSCLIYIM